VVCRFQLLYGNNVGTGFDWVGSPSTKWREQILVNLFGVHSPLRRMRLIHIRLSFDVSSTVCRYVPAWCHLLLICVLSLDIEKNRTPSIHRYIFCVYH
jgi:hypothetical protein